MGPMHGTGLDSIMNLDAYCNIPRTLPRYTRLDDLRTALVEVDKMTKEEAAAAEPRDSILDSLKEVDSRANKDRVKAEKDVAAERRKMFDEGRGDELPLEARVRTPGQIAHQLMQSGDYGIGPPYPVEGAGPPWRRKGLEGTDNVTVQTDHAVIGSSKSMEITRCFDGNGLEQPCGQLYKLNMPEKKDKEELLGIFGFGCASPLSAGPAAWSLRDACLLARCARGSQTTSTQKNCALRAFL
eukprot:TRINITY_DN78906_c0_g1_i1.p1 TRINITY_DN78906_c0_g1~~TRINITY_DN78906_c0_g1_i1.p1  ORF type:complete len:248 (-),score=45.84 TRINITY_DN78906_c0_g1_i1:79-801(-)